MGYACPVCETPQRDAEHLANHLAFTAMLHADEHEAWLDDVAPGWADGSPEELADRVVDHAEETAYDEVFEDTVHGHGHGRGDGHGHEHGHGHGHGHSHGHGSDRSPGTAGSGGPAVDPSTAARRGAGDSEAAADVLREARELTRRMYEEGDEDAPGSRGDDPPGDGDGDDGGVGEGDADTDADGSRPTNRSPAGDGGDDPEGGE
jgi:hypothetical protein